MKKLLFLLLVLSIFSVIIIAEWKPFSEDNLPDPDYVISRSTEADPGLEPLKVILIWHQHQPLYKIPGTLDYEMPWVRAHAVNDYPYMADLADLYLTKGSVTFNLVPSLLLQLKDYVERGAEDKYMRLSLKDDLSEEERSFVIEHFFDINSRFVESSKRYSELAKMRNTKEKFTDSDLLDLKALWNLYWINIEYINSDEFLKTMLEKDRDYTAEDIKGIIDKHLVLITETLEKYKNIWNSGKVELTTTPMYHPILPILIEKGWREDAIAQIETGFDYFNGIMGRKPAGIWPSEQAVNNDLVSILTDLEIEWLVTDKAILQKAGINTGITENILKPYKLIEGGRELNVFFRDTDLSDRIGFRYSTMDATSAVIDFISGLHELQRKNVNGDGVITIALDGENAWEHYPNNGNDFRKLLYTTLSVDEHIEMLTPEQYLGKYEVSSVLDYLPTGSWAGGSLDTWIGEKEENDAWEILEEARTKFYDRLSSMTPDAVAAATEALFTAEGSDWFWWYGADQDAGINEPLFDLAFKKAIIKLYTDIGYAPEEIPPSLYVIKKGSATSEDSIKSIKPEIDGRIADGEWENTAYFRKETSQAMVAGNDMISGVYVGRDNSNIYMAIQLKKNAKELIGQSLYLEIYTDIPDPVNINPVPRYPFADETAYTGFPLSKRFFISFRSWEKRPGRVSVNVTSKDGKWSVDPEFPSVQNGAAIGDVVEVKIPFDTIGIKTGQELNAIVILSDSKQKLSLDYLPGEGPINILLPKAVTGNEVANFDDPEGDDYGPGSYTYPTNEAFEPLKGLFDIKNLRVLENEEAVIFQVKFFEMTNPWGAPKGFSHQLINLYIDSKEGGRTDTYNEGARVEFHEEHPWDYFIKVAGWPSYGQLFATSDNQEIPDSVQVEADPGEQLINIIVSKKAIDLKMKKLYLYVLSGSQDGYGPDNFRPIGLKASDWALGGYPMDAGEFAPYVLDIIIPEGYTQKEVLSSYDKGTNKYSILIPVEVDF